MQTPLSHVVAHGLDQISAHAYAMEKTNRDLRRIIAFLAFALAVCLVAIFWAISPWAAVAAWTVIVGVMFTCA